MTMALAAVVRDEFSAPFFDAAARGVLMLRYSPSSGEWSEPSAVLCAVTQADDLEWREASGTGTIVSWTVKPGRSRDGDVTPDVTIALVETTEGPWLSMWLAEADPAALVVGAPVRIGFDRSTEDSEWLPIGQVA